MKTDLLDLSTDIVEVLMFLEVGTFGIEAW